MSNLLSCPKNTDIVCILRSYEQPILPDMCKKVMDAVTNEQTDWKFTVNLTGFRRGPIQGWILSGTRAGTGGGGGGGA